MSDQIARSKPPQGEMLKEVINIFRKWKEKKTSYHNEDKSTVDKWSIFSERFSSDSESDEEFNNRLAALDNGKKLKRRSTLVSDFGFKKLPDVRNEPKKLDTIGENSTDSNNQNKADYHVSPNKNLLKWVKNKRKINTNKLIEI